MLFPNYKFCVFHFVPNKQCKLEGSDTKFKKDLLNVENPNCKKKHCAMKAVEISGDGTFVLVKRQ